MKYSILIAVLVYEVLVIGGVGLFLARREARREHREGDFALGGRNLPVSVVAVTLALTVLGTAHILGEFEMAWFMGASAVWFSIAHVILLVVVYSSTGLWMRRLGVSTVPEILETLYGPATRLVVSCVMAGVIFGILTIETQGIGIIMASMTGWEIQYGAIVGGILGIMYVIFAGLSQVGWVNLINAVVMYVGLILATIFLALKLPGGNYDSVSNFYTAAGEGHMVSIFGTSEIMFTFALGTVIAVVFSQGINQMLLQPAMAARNEKTIKRALWIAAPLNGMFGVFVIVIGLTAKSIPEFQAMGPKIAATSLLVNYLPGWLAAMLLASISCRDIVHVCDDQPQSCHDIHHGYLQAPVSTRCRQARPQADDSHLHCYAGRHRNGSGGFPASDNRRNELAILMARPDFLGGYFWPGMEAKFYSRRHYACCRLGRQYPVVVYIIAGDNGDGKRDQPLYHAGRDPGPGSHAKYCYARRAGLFQE